MSDNAEFDQVVMNDPTVQAGMQSGAGVEAIIIALAKEKKALQERLVLLEQIAPRRVRTGGKDYVWRCPDELVPLSGV